MREIAALVLFKLFISGNKRCHTTESPYSMNETPFSNVNNINEFRGKETYNYRLKVEVKVIFSMFWPYFFENYA